MRHDGENGPMRSRTRLKRWILLVPALVAMAAGALAASPQLAAQNVRATRAAEGGVLSSTPYLWNSDVNALQGQASSSHTLAGAADGASPSEVKTRLEPSRAESTHRVLPMALHHYPEATRRYLPLIGTRYPPKPASVGAHMFRVVPSHGLAWARAAGVQWARLDAFNWADIEPVRTEPPTYHWETVDEESLVNATAARLETIAIVRHTPVWAQKVVGYACGPIKQGALDEFGQFLAALVERYSAPPFQVHYWELWNEPDVDPSLVADGNSPFGCWGDLADEQYYGGGYYATMLQVAYPAIKAADPQAQVLLGGLLLDCDPSAGLSSFDLAEAVPQPAEKADGACQVGRFFEGILANGGGDYLDIVGFHGYPPYDGSLQQDLQFGNWDGRGGIVMGKIDYLRDMLSAYGLDKPLMHTEGALVCPEWSPALCSVPGPAFYEAQADYVVWLYIRNWAAGVQATAWYTWEGPGWRHGGLLDENQNPRPAYWALHFLTNELARYSYTGPVTLYPSLQGYEFSVTGKRVWVLWAPDEVPHSVTLPAGTVRVFDKYGGDITPPGDTLSVSSPVYVELIP